MDNRVILLIEILVLAGVAVGIWFLTGYDKTWSGESLRDRHFLRLIRTGAVVFLLAIGLPIAQSGSEVGALYLMAVPFGIAILLRSAISEIFTHGFIRMADPFFGDQGTHDPKKGERYLATVMHLVRTGQHDQAIKLCEEFKRTGEVDHATLQNLLDYLGVKQERPRLVEPAMEARQLRAAGRFTEAEKFLCATLEKKPGDFESALLLIRIYLEDLHKPVKAQAVLVLLESQPHLAPALLDIARQTVQAGKPSTAAQVEETTQKPRTVEEALAEGALGTAVALLEEQIKQNPQDFATRLQLMELQAKRCSNFPRAEKILKELENSGLFSDQQTSEARSQLRQWRNETK